MLEVSLSTRRLARKRALKWWRKICDVVGMNVLIRCKVIPMTGRVTVAPESPERGLNALRTLLTERAHRYTDWPHWLHIDDVERRRGASAGKPREKFTTLDELLNK